MSIVHKVIRDELANDRPAVDQNALHAMKTKPRGAQLARPIPGWEVALFDGRDMLAAAKRSDQPWLDALALK